jgi:hypothetical protein
MIYYLQLLMGVVLAQTFVGCMITFYYKRNHPEVPYTKAWNLYFTREVGTFAVILSFLAMIMFAMPDWLDTTLTREDLLAKEKLTKFEAIQIKFRTWTAGVGGFLQWIAIFFFKGGRNAIENYAAKQGVDINSDPKL